MVFWKSIICGKHDKIFFLLYKLLLDLRKHNMFHSEWLYKIESIMNDTAGLSEYWFTQNIPSNISVKKTFNIPKGLSDAVNSKNGQCKGQATST